MAILNREQRLSAGDWVEVRSKEEVLKTLDSRGQLDGMPFMPEMFAFCGKRFQVYKRAHKTCDTVFPIRGRRLDGAVHLETRCDGEAHGGCQAGCLLFWKEAWLKRVNGKFAAEAPVPIQIQSIQIQPGGSKPVVPRASPAGGCTEFNVLAGTRKPAPDEDAYVCQATQLPYMTTRLEWWDLRQYMEDYWSGNVGLWRIFRGLVYSSYYNLSSSRFRLGSVMRWLYNKLHWLWRGPRFPRNPGKIPLGQPTPTVKLNLQPGELVRVKSHEEILRTLTADNKNRGMHWDAELVPFCGGTYRVLKSVTRILDEKTGKMQEMKNPCIILDTVVCESRYSACRMFCPRAIYSFWREVWLERVEPKISAGETDRGVYAGASRQEQLQVADAGAGRTGSKKG